MTTRNALRRGFTLIEVLVTIVIIAVLFGLLLAAVQRSRDAARRTRCANNLKQIGLAMNNYEASSGTLPPGWCWHGFSLYVPLLSHLGQPALFNSMNLDLGVSMGNDYPAGTPIDAHYTAAVTRLDVLICPSDPEPSWNSGTTSYAGSVGYGFQGSPRLAAGVFDAGLSSSATPLAQVIDGTSNTVAISEWIRGAGLGVSWDARANIYAIPATSDFDRFVEECDGSVGVYPVQTNGKRCYWIETGLGDTLYNHNQGIGKPTCDDHSNIGGSMTAASHHPGGAHALAVDGHVQFFKDTMAREVWRGLGTRSGGELIPDSY